MFDLVLIEAGNRLELFGEIMADLITACETGHDHDAKPVKFHLKNIDRTISLGFCSQKREVNQQSSFSVRG